MQSIRARLLSLGSSLHLIALLIGGTVGPVHGAQPMAQVERVAVQTTGSSRISAGLTWESERKLTPTTRYDNLRLFPLGVRYGLLDRFEIGVDLGYSSNTDGLDEDDLEFVMLSGKYRYNQFLAASVSIGRSLGERVLPYGGEGTRVDASIPAEYPFGPGVVLAELGYVMNSGDFGQTGEWDDYAHYGVGYAYEMTRRFEVVTEVAGHGPTVDLPSTATRNHLSFNLMGHYQVSRTSTLTPSLRVGARDGSPDVAVGLGYSIGFGIPEPARRRYYDTAPMNVTPDTATDAVVLRSASSASETDSVQQLMERGRRAYENGQLQKAVRLYQQALKEEPNNVDVLSNLASLYFRQGRYEKARDLYRRSLEQAPDDYFSHLYLGMTYERLEQYDRARSHYERAGRLRPGASEPDRRLRRLPEP